MSNPLTDLIEFMIGDTGDYNRFGAVKYISVAFYILLVAGGLYVAWLCWSRDPAQRTSKNLFVAGMRIILAGMWFQGTIWKLPLPVADGFKYWLTAEVKSSSFPGQGAIVRDLFLPHIALLQPAVYLLEVFFAVSLTLGIAVRLSGVLAAIFTLQLWLGLYNDPTEWAWTYIAIVFAEGMFVTAEAGRSLGLDHLLRFSGNPFVTRDTVLSHAYRLAS